MTKKQEAMEKAKESGKKIVEGGKEFGAGAGAVVGGTVKLLEHTFKSGRDAGISKISRKKSENPEYSDQARKEHKEKAEEYSKRAKELRGKAGESAKQVALGLGEVIKGGAKAVGHSVKGGYHLIDAGDKAMGEKIAEKRKEKGENKVSKMRNFVRNNILKLLIAGSILGYGGTEVVKHNRDRNTDKIEVVQGADNYKAIIKELFGSDDVLLDLGGSGKKWQDKRENRYLGNDEAWNNMKNGFGIAERKKVIEGMCRMIESGDLEMVMKKADAAGVPRQCVFLALAESGWQAGADSGVAGGYWQFTKGSARLFGLIDEEGNDFRADPEKSTDAAMKHLQENYEMVSKYAKKQGYNMSESDKWIFAFHMYNGSPTLVKKGIKSCKGDANKYSEMQSNTENRNYVPRILAIQDALSELFIEYEYDIQKIKSKHLNKHSKKTEADVMFEEFGNNKSKLSKKEGLEKLDVIKSKYKEEYDAKKISKAYYEGAISIIDEEISSFE